MDTRQINIPAAVEITTQLNAAETTELARLETVIDTGRETFIAVGEALREIKVRGLYRVDYPTFEEYCRERWGFTRQYAYNLIKASDIADTLSTSGLHMPSNERVARELASIEDEQDRALVWQLASETAPKGEVTTTWLKATKTAVEVAKATQGYVDTGDGQMTAMEAAITQEAAELKERQKQHMSNGSEPLIKATLTISEGIESLQGLLAAKGDLRVRVVVYEVAQ